ncbi:MAG: hypothetical protein ACOC21_03880 [Halanaerobiales bacterium]
MTAGETGPEELINVRSVGEKWMVRELKKRLGYEIKEKKKKEKTKKIKKIRCIFCNSTKNIRKHRGKYICSSCYHDLTQKI